jgi:hypothetical protein
MTWLKTGDIKRKIGDFFCISLFFHFAAAAAAAAAEKGAWGLQLQHDLVETC